MFDPACCIEIIITVQALKEGWDCSFAYVFCSVANIHSSKDVEQLLGRVLRMPYARRRPVEELNRAYAHVSSSSFAQAANYLKDALVSMGFEQEEAETVILRQEDWLGGATPLPPARAPAPAPVKCRETGLERLRRIVFTQISSHCSLSSTRTGPMLAMMTAKRSANLASYGKPRVMARGFS